VQYNIKLIGEWESPKDEDVDVAVMSIEPPDGERFFWDDLPYDTPDKPDYGYLHIEVSSPEMSKRLNMFADQKVIESYGIGIGDDIRVVGLFSEHTGKERNVPVARRGIIAAMPDEPLEVEIDGKKRRFNAYIVEVRSIGGLSGSPVFVMKEKMDYDYEFTRGQIPTSEYMFFLLGMVRGHWDYRKQYSLRGVTDKELDQVNMGMAYVTPIQDVIDVLYGENMREQRKKDDKETLA